MTEEKCIVCGADIFWSTEYGKHPACRRHTVDEVIRAAEKAEHAAKATRKAANAGKPPVGETKSPVVGL